MTTTSDTIGTDNTIGTDTQCWAVVCRSSQLPAEFGVAAIVGDVQVALFRTFDNELYAIDNRDPFSGAYVLSRGIVGSRDDAPTIASPMLKQVFDLRSGRCLDADGVTLATHPIRERDGFIEVSFGAL